MKSLVQIILNSFLMPVPGLFRLGARGRRGQARVESAVALGVLIVAGVGAWMLYKDAIVETTKAMIGFFGAGDEG